VPARNLRIAALVKQIPSIERMALDANGRLVRDGDLEMSAYCRRAVSKSVELAMASPGSSVVVATLGPPAALDVLREAVAWGFDRGVDICGILLTDPAFAGSDTIATARALAAVLEREGPFDLVLAGRNSLDADTGQVPPQLAELLDMPFASDVKRLALDDGALHLGCQHDDTWVDVEVRLPALLTCAERLCDPAKVDPERWAQVPARLIRQIGADEVGPGPWGAAGSLTTVGPCRVISIDRLQRVTPDIALAAQVSDAVRVLTDRRALIARESRPLSRLPATNGAGPVVAVIGDGDHDALTRELCNMAASLAARVGGSTLLFTAHAVTAAEAGSWGADCLTRIEGAHVAEDIAAAVAAWALTEDPWAILAGSTSVGREVASRVAAAIGAGLTGDAVDLAVIDNRLVAWKPAFGGQLLAAIEATSAVQMATIRAGVLPHSMPRNHVARESTVSVVPRHRVRVRARSREDSLEGLAEADVVIGVGRGVAPDELSQLDELRQLLGAELGCTRKVTDAGWMPHARQIGITGRSIAPRLYLAIGMSGKLNHMVGVRNAGTVLAINPDRDAPIWAYADVGIVGTFQECVPLLTDALRRALAFR